MQPTNDNGFREMRTLAGVICLTVLAFHYYYFCYRALAGWGLTYPILDRLTAGLGRSGLFHHRAISKLIVLAAVAATNIGMRSPTQVRSRKRLLVCTITGSVFFFWGDAFLYMDSAPSTVAILYIASTLTGLTLLYISIKGLVSIFFWQFRSDVFNRFNESFPQEERLLTNPYSINLKARYSFRNQFRDSYINLVEIFRGTLVMGTPGSGKTRYIF